MVTVEQATEELKRLLAKRDVWGALRYLNCLTPHRYTAIYLFHDPVCVNHLGVDKENPAVFTLWDVPLEASYCSLVRSLNRPFLIGDSMEEAMLNGHPAREAFRSYIAVPLVGPDGEVLGTVCHFDARALPVEPDMVDLLSALGTLVAPLAPEHVSRLKAESLN